MVNLLLTQPPAATAGKSHVGESGEGSGGTSTAYLGSGLRGRQEWKGGGSRILHLCIRSYELRHSLLI